MKETYRVATPKKLIFGDPLYFEQFSGEKLEQLVVDLEPHRRFEARVVLEEEQFEKGSFEDESLENDLFEDDPDFMLRTMTIFLAPSTTMETYLKGQMYQSQEAFEKDIGVDTAQYYLRVDDRDETIHTGGDGYWGHYLELRRPSISGRTILDAVIITVLMPEHETMDSMREWLNYFFSDVTLTENIERTEQKQKDSQKPPQPGMKSHM